MSTGVEKTRTQEQRKDSDGTPGLNDTAFPRPVNEDISVELSQEQLSEQISTLSEQVRRLNENMSAVVVGMEEARRFMIVAALIGKHILLEGLPGLGKTLLCNAFAQSLGLEFQRIQFTPDLTAQDIIGFQRQTKDGSFAFQRGPIFGNIILADEVNRSPGKTQSALLEAMQEGQVTVDRETYRLPRPFLVMATQNPLESSSATYPLPDAQLDRIGVMINVPYPTAEELIEIIVRDSNPVPGSITQLFSAEESERLFLNGGALARGVLVEPRLIQSVAAMCRWLNPRVTNKTEVPKATRDAILQGPSPRAGSTLLQFAKGIAVLEGRSYVKLDDLKEAALPVLQHRIQLSDRAEEEGTTAQSLIKSSMDRLTEEYEKERN